MKTTWLVLGLAMGFAPTADAEWMHIQLGKTMLLDKKRTATRAFAQVFLTNTGDRVQGGADAWSKGSSIKYGAGLGNWKMTTSVWRPEPEDPVGEIEWTGDLVMDLEAEAREGESAAAVTATAEFRLVVDSQEMVHTTLGHTLGIESEEHLITSIQVSPGGIGVQVPVSIATGHGLVELSDTVPITPDHRCCLSAIAIRQCFAFAVTHADGWYSFLLGIGRVGDATAGVDAKVKDKIYYIDTCGE